MNLSGQSAEASLVVQQSDTADALRLGDEDAFPAVFATSRMVALMEIAAARLMRPLLGEGELSVGVSIDVRHGAATPVGHRVRAVATYLGDDDPSAANTQDAPDRVAPRPGADVPVDGGMVRMVLPPLSWNMLRLAAGSRD